MAKQPTKRMRATTNSWAIETGLAGQLYLASATGFPALYSSRQTARAALARLKPGYRLPPAARAVRVAVTVTTIGRG